MRAVEITVPALAPVWTAIVSLPLYCSRFLSSAHSAAYESALPACDVMPPFRFSFPARSVVPNLFRRRPNSPPRTMCV